MRDTLEIIRDDLIAALKTSRTWIVTAACLALAALAGRRLGGGVTNFVNILSVTAALSLLGSLAGGWSLKTPSTSRWWGLNYRYAQNYRRMRYGERKGGPAYLCSALLQGLVVAVLLLTKTA